jgi:hypothetical protein
MTNIKLDDWNIVYIDSPKRETYTGKYVDI